MSVLVDHVSTDGATGTVPGRPRGRRVRSRWTAGHVLPVVLAVLAAVFVLAGLRDRSATVKVPVAARAIPAGMEVDTADTRLVSAHRSDGILVGGLLSRAELGGGWVAAVNIGAGQAITRSEVTAAGRAGSGLGSMSIPVPVADADGGAIAVGDQVDVIEASGGGASYVAAGLRVLAVAPAQTSGVLGGASSSYYVTVAVDRATALRIAAAVGTGASTGTSSGGVEVVRSTGETGSPPAGYQSAQPSSGQASAAQASTAGAGSR